MGKDVAASAEGDGLADQLFAVDGHQRSMPYFIEDPYRRCTCVAVTQSLQPFTKSFCELVGNRVGARQPAQRLDLFGDIVEPSGFADENGESQRTQPFDVPGAVAALPGQNQIRLQGDDRLEIQAGVVTDARDLFRLGWVVAVTHGPHQRIARPGGEQVFGVMRRQTDDASGGLRKADHIAERILHHDLRPHLVAHQGYNECKHEPGTLSQAHHEHSFLAQQTLGTDDARRVGVTV